MIDDGWSLTPKTKLGLETLIVTGFVLAGRGGNERFTGLVWLDLPLILFWLVTTTNAFNLIDGLDGLAAGIGIIDALAIAAAAALGGQMQTAVLAAVLAGALAGFLLYNFRPAQIFMGDAGAAASWIPAGSAGDPRYNARSIGSIALRFPGTGHAGTAAGYGGGKHHQTRHRSADLVARRGPLASSLAVAWSLT